MSEEQPSAEPNLPAPQNPKRRRRGHRGGRGRRRPAQISSPDAPVASEPGLETAPVIGKIVEEVRQIVESLEQTLEQMEEVLRLVEQAESQKTADEHEIESLRRALRKIQSPRKTPDAPIRADG
ncbi:MAG TPA: hypothetical protein VHG71_09060 [Verrucomicrobiae bacterium]|nr:hypothetical protein [Verrucomicrobiae bacterium]